MKVLRIDVVFDGTAPFIRTRTAELPPEWAPDHTSNGDFRLMRDPTQLFNTTCTAIKEFMPQCDDCGRMAATRYGVDFLDALKGPEPPDPILVCLNCKLKRETAERKAALESFPEGKIIFSKVPADPIKALKASMKGMSKSQMLATLSKLLEEKA